MSKKAGRPPIVDDIALQKLEEVFALGGTDKEACLYANISPATLYNYQQSNPSFLERKELLKNSPVLLARRTVLDALTDDPQTARWYLERRDKDFHPKSESEVKNVKEYRLADEQLQKDAEQLVELQKTKSAGHS